MSQNNTKYELAMAKSVAVLDKRAARREEDDFDSQVQVEELDGPEGFGY